jgi:catechol-2,3-dioxygenase
MKHMHIHIAVDELNESIRFYSAMFGAAPTIERDDYAKWQLNDPAVNFAISSRGQSNGLNHLGIQVDSENELAEISQRLDAAKIASSKQKGANCCYAKSDKHWVLDPQGIAWETFHTLSSIPTFGEETSTAPGNDSAACCMPDQSVTSGCCT